MTGPNAEAPRPLGAGEGEAVTVAFSDHQADVCGIARVGLAMTDAGLRTSGLGLLFAGGEPVAVRAGSGEPDDSSGAWAGATAAGVETEVIEPFRTWSVLFGSEDGRHGFDLELTALSPVAVLPEDSAAGRLGGMTGYDQLVAARGTVTVDGRDRDFSGTGQRGHSWGRPDWSKLSRARTVGVWWGDGSGVTATAIRPRGSTGLKDEAVHAVVLAGADHEPVAVRDPRLSTTYDSGGRQKNAGIELWMTGDDDEQPTRLSGEVACGTTLDLGQLRLDCAFFTWSDGIRHGVGRYDLMVSS